MHRLGPGEYDRAAAVFLDPQVQGFLLGMDREALQRALQSPTAFVLMGDPGCAFLVYRLAGKAYQIHQAALPAARGKRMATAGRNVIAWMFENTNAEALVGITPSINRGALAMAYLCGFKKIGEIPRVFGEYAAVITSINRATPSRGPEGGQA